MSKTIYEATLSEALPDSISRDSSAQAVCAGVDPQIRAMSANLDVPAWMSRVQTMSSDELDHVAYTFGSHVWMNDWSLEQKRAYIVEVVARKKIVGTPAAIIDVFTQLGYTVRYEDCMTRPAMEPGTFLVSLVNEPVPSDDQWQMRWIVDNIKPASRTWRWDNRIEARHTARAVAAFTGCMWQRHEAVLTEEVIEEFGEIIKAYLTADGAANTSTMWINATERPLYDEAGSPLLFESGYKYDVLGVGNKGINGDAYLNTVSPGEQMAVYASYNFRVSSNIVFIFKVASGESFAIYPLVAGYSIQGSVTIAAGSFGFLYVMGSGSPVGYSSLAGKVLRDVISGTGERLGTDGFVIEENDNGYAILRNNRAESVTVGRVIFSDLGGE